MTFSELDVDIKLYMIGEKEEINNSAKKNIFEIAKSAIQTKVESDTPKSVIQKLETV